MNADSFRFTHEAMATVFEVVIAGESEKYSRQAAQAVFAEIDRLEGLLSRFIESSDVTRINRLGFHQPVKVSIEFLECLRIAAEVYNETEGAFDITLGDVLDRWKDARESFGGLSEEWIQRLKTGGMNQLEVFPESLAVSLQSEGLTIDLGGIGKGYALDQAVQILDDWSIESALIHGGESTVLATGSPPGSKGWSVRIGEGMGESAREILLRDRAISSSGTRVKGRHIIDPWTGLPARGIERSWVSCPSASVSDALSTAFMVMNLDAIEQYCSRHPDTWALLLDKDRIVAVGDTPQQIAE